MHILIDMLSKCGGGEIKVYFGMCTFNKFLMSANLPSHPVHSYFFTVG